VEKGEHYKGGGLKDLKVAGGGGGEDLSVGLRL